MRPQSGRMRAHKALPLVSLCFALASCTCTAETVESTLKLDIASGIPVVSGVFLNGHGPYHFVLDTGGETNQIDAQLAQKLGITASLQLESMTLSGGLQSGGAVIDQVSVGSVKAVAQEFLFTSGGSLRSIAPYVQGILGQEFLRHFDYTLDFKHHRVTFGDAPPGGDRVEFRLADGRMTVTTNQGDMLLDSGAQTLILFRAPQSAETALATEFTNIVTTNGRVTAEMDRAPSLTVGGKRYYPESAVFHPLSDAPAAGLLPANLFRAVFVSNTGGYVVFNPNQ
jgi:hypothetical protein